MNATVKAWQLSGNAERNLDRLAPAAYVVTFDPRPVTGPGAINGLRRMTLADARALVRYAEPERHGRIIHAETLATV